MAFSNKTLSDDSSTDANHSSSDDHQNRFFSQPLVRRQSSSSSSSSSTSSDSESDESAEPADPPVRSYDKPEVQSSNPAKQPVKAAKTAAAKRSREEEDEEEVEEEAAPKPPPKKKIVSKKVDTPKKPQSQAISHKTGVDIEEKIPSRDLKKKIIASSPPKDDSAKEVAGAVPAKDSPHKSAKKAQHVWSAEDEIALVKGILAFLNADGNGGKALELPKNMVPIYEQVKHLLSYEYSNVQLYDKMRRMKSKFQALNDKLKGDSGFAFKSPHDATMFRLWKQLWSQQSNGNAIAGQEEQQPGNAVADEDNEDERKSTEEDREIQEEDEEERRRDREAGQVKKNRGASLPKPQNGKVVYSASQTYNILCEESRAIVNEVKNDVRKMLEDAQSKTMNLVENMAKGKANSLQRPYGELMNGIFSGKGFPVLNSRSAQTLERKWREQHILEMEAFSKRLDLLQEECRMGLEELKSPVDGERS